MSDTSFQLLDQNKPILVFGRDGQVGKALQTCLKKNNAPFIFLGRSDCDLANVVNVKEVLHRYQPRVIINAAAYTAVDRAEAERPLAIAINAKAPSVMAQYMTKVSGGVFIHYSTDYVFLDTKKRAYSEIDETGPVDQLCVYGQSKLLGEQAIHKAFDLLDVGNTQTGHVNSSRYFILRASWVYGDGGNFIKTMLRLAAEQSELRVVADQIGVPTSAQWLAEVTLELINSQAASGIYHVVPDGETSWYDLAKFAIAEALSSKQLGLINPPKILPILAVEYPLPARRPLNSRLNNVKLKNLLSTIRHSGNYPVWQEQVAAYIKFGQKSN